MKRDCYTLRFRSDVSKVLRQDFDGRRTGAEDYGAEGQKLSINCLLLIIVLCKQLAVSSFKITLAI